MTSEAIIESCAKAAHAVNGLYCAAIGDVVLGPWETLPEARREGIRQGVRDALADPNRTPEESHVSWCAAMEADGWKYSAKRDERRKRHPCLVRYEQLPAKQRAKDAQFLAVVRAHAAALRAAGVE